MSRRGAVLISLFALTVPPVLFASPKRIAIERVAVSPSTFNPSAGESVGLDVVFARKGRVTVRIVDRDGFVVKTIASSIPADEGSKRFRWNGTDERGAVISDEAYSIRIDWLAAGLEETYFPALQAQTMTSVPVRYYSRRSGTISYDLPVASRIHLQAGTARPNPKTHEMEGPVMKTIVNREPRAAGQIAEQWSGLDESGSVFVPDLPDFVLAVAATPLPENSIIAFGNHSARFLDYVQSRSGISLFASSRAAEHLHHQGLSTLGDVSPMLEIEPLNARWSEAERIWIVRDRTIRLRATPTGPTASTFVQQPGTLYEFVDGRLRTRYPVKRDSVTVEMPATALSSSGGLISINWQSDYGPLASNSLRMRLDQSATGPAADRKGALR